MTARTLLTGAALGAALLALGGSASAQLRDVKEKMTLPQANAADGIHKNLPEQVGAGRGNINTIGSSIYIINRDPARAIRRGSGPRGPYRDSIRRPLAPRRRWAKA